MTEQILKNFEGTHQKIAAVLTDYVTGGYVRTLSKLLVYMGQKQGSLNEKMTIARRLLELKMPEEQVISVTKLTKQEVEELSKTIKQ